MMEHYLMSGLSVLMFIVIVGSEIFGIYIELMHFIHLKTNQLELKNTDGTIYDYAIKFRKRISRSALKVFITFVIIVPVNIVLYSNLEIGELITFGFFVVIIIMISKVFIDE